MVAIKWMQGVRNLENILLRPIYDEIPHFFLRFNSISFFHAYGKRNGDADALSKRFANENGFMACV